ncbi:hypothetical protein N657DRAFT_645238 [Parathielavia appendiculata]|uniref:Uncharacterized protein n=1 Tax=Parathielavia appendiculata TaxID=2587402 RepID=A0AAN6U0E5_9PEZI|nr:hypothetical protein N657DRAFT_645238 [Parathielavia appendiculata]
MSRTCDATLNPILPYWLPGRFIGELNEERGSAHTCGQSCSPRPLAICHLWLWLGALVDSLALCCGSEGEKTPFPRALLGQPVCVLARQVFLNEGLMVHGAWNQLCFGELGEMTRRLLERHSKLGRQPQEAGR